MLRFYYEPRYKYTNRTIIDISEDNNYRDINYENIDSPDTINGHIIYVLQPAEKLPTYIVDLGSGWRWFVSGITQLRTGKYQISLLRDIISETSLWKEEEAYIEAGTAIDYNKYKTWELPYTNTKLREQRLNINGKSSYFVYYVNTQNFSNGAITEQDLEISSVGVPGITGYDVEVSNLNEIPNFNFVGAGNINVWTRKKANFNLTLRYISGTTRYFRRYPINFDSFQTSNNNMNIGEYTQQYSVVNYITNSVIASNTQITPFTNNTDNIRTNTRNAVSSFLDSYQSSLGYSASQQNINDLDSYINKIIYNTTDNKLYRISKTSNLTEYNETLNQTQTDPLLAVFRNIFGTDQTSEKAPWFTFQSTVDTVSYTIEELGTANTFNFNFSAEVRKLPKSAVRCVNIVSSAEVSDTEIGQCLLLAQANNINLNNDTGRIIDIQYLPFSYATKTNEDFKINGTSIIAEFIDNDDLYYTSTLPSLTNINKEVDSIKIVSPSRASQFMFRPYNNDGRLVFDIQATIRPYKSVIYVRPSTEGLLLYNFDDKDCLVISEDFSLSNVNSEWAQYIYTNRNFQNTFEREIQGREFERSWERRIEQAQAKSDKWTARNISSQKAKTYTANLPIVSGIAGAVGTAFMDENYMKAAQLDREYNEALYQEGLSISRDLFSYQIDNIKSQPTIPSKLTTIDCKLLDGVYLEFYGTNDTELEAINNYYKYNGNRIDCYGTFSQYYGHFVRGKIIKSINYTQPEIDELNRRLSMGIFTEVIYDK